MDISKISLQENYMYPILFEEITWLFSKI